MHESLLRNSGYIEVAFKYACWFYLQILGTMLDGRVMSTIEDMNA